MSNLTVDPGIVPDLAMEAEVLSADMAAEEQFANSACGRLYLVWLGLCCLVLVALLAGYPQGFSHPIMAAGIIIYLIVFIVHVVRAFVLLRPVDWFAPDMLFLFFYAIFHFGYIGPYLLDMLPFDDYVIPSINNGNKCILFSSLCGILFLFGYELYGAIRGKRIRLRSVTATSDMHILCTQVLLFIGGGLLLVGIMQAGVGAVMSDDYFAELSAERVERDARFLTLAPIVISMATIMLVSASFLARRKYVVGILSKVLLSAWFLATLLSSRRSSMLGVILPMLLLRNYMKKPFKFCTIAITGVLALFVFATLGTVREYGLFSFSALSQAASTDKPFLRASLEAGRSINTVNATMMIVPNEEPYWYGRSYVDSIMQLLPNVLPGLRNVVSPPKWITVLMIEKGLSGRAGWGSSLAMEAYLNFGAAGCLVLALLGLFYRWLYDATIARPNFVRVTTLCVAIMTLCILPRNNMGLFFRPIGWSFILSWIIDRISRKGEHLSAAYETTSRS